MTVNELLIGLFIFMIILCFVCPVVYWLWIDYFAKFFRRKHRKI